MIIKKKFSKFECTTRLMPDYLFMYDHVRTSYKPVSKTKESMKQNFIKHDRNQQNGVAK